MKLGNCGSENNDSCHCRKDVFSMKAATVQEMRNLDTGASRIYDISEELLMENAGLAVFQLITEEIGLTGRQFLVLSGSGNNGGDGFVAARKIHSNGGNVKVRIIGDPSRYAGAAELNYRILSRTQIDMQVVKSMEEVREAIDWCDVIVDGLFGTGLTRTVEGLCRDVIEHVNDSGKTIVSIDIPSGINADTGETMGAAIRGDYTVTFGLPKRGTLLYPGFDHCGKLSVSHISFPPVHYETDEISVMINDPAMLPSRNQEGHKGTFGDALFIAGSANYYGAPYLAALSFLKGGGGYSRLATPRSVAPFVAVRGSEIVLAPQSETMDGSLSLSCMDELLRLVELVDIVVIGPGLSLQHETRNLTEELIRRIHKPLVIDGDGLTILSAKKEILQGRKEPTVLTPHLGEMSRIMAQPADEVGRRRIECAREVAMNMNAFIVLKGAHSIVSCPDGRNFINMSGNSGMASAGSGDVLTGAIAAMYGLGLPVEKAVRNGVFLHGCAGDLAAEEIGQDGMTAEDVLSHLPEAVRRLREKYESICRLYSINTIL